MYVISSSQSKTDDHQAHKYMYQYVRNDPQELDKMVQIASMINV